MKVILLLAYNDENDSNWVPSLGLGYLCSFINKNLENVDISIEKDINDVLKEDNIDSVGISSSTQNINIAKKYALQVKNKLNAITFLGGPHITALPKALPSEFDLGIIGEGELVLLNLLKNINRFDDFFEAIKKTKGLVYRNEKGKIVQTEAQSPILNLDQIPFPAREELFYKNPYTVHMMTSRGCPNNCTFCCSKSIWSTVRYFSVDYVVAEIENIISNYHPGVINFFDDVFFKNKEWLNEFADKIKQKGIDKKVDFTCYLRADQTDAETLKLFKDIGMKFIFFGAESGSQEILRHYKDKNASVEKNQKLLDLASRMGIGVGATFIKGFPTETEEDLDETYNFIEKNLKEKKLDIWKIFHLSPFPGSQMWKHARKKGIVSPDMDFSKFQNPVEDLYMNEKIEKEKFLKITEQRENLLSSINNE